MNPDKHHFPMQIIFAGLVLLLTCSVSNAQDESTRDLNGAAQYVAEAKLAEKRLDFSEAISWYEQAARLGDAESMNELGWIYFGAHDIPGRHFQNYPKAATWFQRAADLSYAPAITQLGVMYGADGSEGVPEDDVKAAQLYMKAATMGDAYAMNHLGYVYSHGKGVPKDMGKAVFWWKKAVVAGGEPGKAAQTWLDLLHQ
jgi:TPR repeat protein